MDKELKQIIPMSCPVCDRFYFSKLDEDVDIKQLGMTPNTTQCDMCGWFYDLEQFHDPKLKNQSNEMSLDEYKAWYQKKLLEDPCWEYWKEFVGDPDPHWCPLCGEHLFKDSLSYEICPVCGYQDSGEDAYPDERRIPTEMTFNERKQWFLNQRSLNPRFKSSPKDNRRLKIRITKNTNK